MVAHATVSGLMSGAPPRGIRHAIARAREGDASARNALAREHLSEIGRFVACHLGDPQEVEDVVQETFLLAFGQLDRLREPEKFRFWLKGIALMRVRQLIRKRKMRRLLGFDSKEDMASLLAVADPGLPADQRAELARLDEVLCTLPSEQRIAWSLRYVEGHKLVEAAEIAGCSLATIKRRITAADARVRAKVDIEEGIDG